MHSPKQKRAIELTEYKFDSIKTALDMQSRALVALKAQRDIDRNRRLMLIRRMRKEQNAHKKVEMALKIAVSISLILSLIILITK